MPHGSVVGLDIGGSSTRAVRAVDGVAVAEARTGSANIAAVDRAEAGRRLGEVLAAVGTEGVLAVCAGAAGADSPDSVAVVRDLVAGHVPGARVEIVHDARLILAAAGRPAGIALVSGTGSVAWGRSPGGREARAGGWGHLLGDEGSGFWVAIAAVRHALHRMDAGAPPDALTDAVVAACGLRRREQLIDHAYRPLDKRYWADHAGVVAALASRGDGPASMLMAAAADALAALVTTVATRLGSDAPGPVVVSGGFADHQPLLVEGVRERLPGLVVEVLTEAPVVGAVRLAEQLVAAGPREGACP